MKEKSKMKKNKITPIEIMYAVTIIGMSAYGWIIVLTNGN